MILVMQKARWFDTGLHILGYSATKALDQFVLAWYLWPIAKLDMVAHDSFYCKYFSSPHNWPWPVERLMTEEGAGRNFVGSMFDSHTVKLKCPMECRPEQHPDWEYCWWKKTSLFMPVWFYDVPEGNLWLCLWSKVGADNKWRGYFCNNTDSRGYRRAAETITSSVVQKRYQNLATATVEARKARKRNSTM
jgi:hypothetical protein